MSSLFIIYDEEQIDTVMKHVQSAGFMKKSITTHRLLHMSPLSFKLTSSQLLGTLQM